MLNFLKFLRIRAADNHIALWVGLAFMVVAVAAGGASRADAASQFVVRSASILTVTILLLQTSTSPRFDRVKPALIFLSAAAAIILIQLIPLPSSLWPSLPGREPYTHVTPLLGESSLWRPINLTPDLGWNALFALLPAAATIVLMAYFRTSHRPLLLAALVSIGIASAVLGLAQLTDGAGSSLRWYRITSQGSANGFFANRNHQATLLALSLPVIAVWGAASFRRSHIDRARLGLSLVATAFVLLMVPVTGSRMGLATATVGLVISLYFWNEAVQPHIRSRSPRTRTMIRAGSVAAVLALVLTAVTLSRAQAVQRLFDYDLANDPRMKLGGALVRMMKAFFPFGSGFGSFDPVFRAFEPIELLTNSYINAAHNDFLQVVIEGGVLGAALIAIYLIWWARQAVRLWLSGRQSDSDGLGRLGCAITLIVMLSSIPDYPLRTPLMSVIFVIASLWMSPSLSHPAKRDQFRTPRP